MQWQLWTGTCTDMQVFIETKSERSCDEKVAETGSSSPKSTHQFLTTVSTTDRRPTITAVSHNKQIMTVHFWKHFPPTGEHNSMNTPSF